MDMFDDEDNKEENKEENKDKIIKKLNLNY